MSLFPSRPGPFIPLLACCVCGGLLLGSPQTAQAAELRVALQDADSGAPLADAVVEVLLPEALQPAHTTLGDYSVDQIDKEFVANVTVVPRGSSVSFPNSDDILHHVYSFSPAKVFELPLYGNGQNIDYQQMFDVAGVVELGCNIHDWMLGYVYVAQTSLAVKTDAQGQATLTGIPAGTYEVRLWHPRARAGAPELQQTLVFDDATPATLRMAVTLERDNRLRRAPNPARERYR
jgi:plastocyanin